MLLYNLILLPALIGILCAVIPGWNRKNTLMLMLPQGLLAVGAVALAVAGTSMATPVFSLTDTLTFSLAMDGLGRFFTVLVAACWLFSIPYASVYMEHEAHRGRFYAFFFLTEAAVIGTSLAADFTTLYLFFEMATLLSFPLVLHDQSEAALLGARKYFFYSVGGAFVALFGVVALYREYGTLVFSETGTSAALTPLAMLGVFLMIIGFGAKAGLYPLHNWLPSAHPAAPSPASALLSGLIAKCGVIAIIRLLFFLVGADALRGTWVQYTAIALALVTVAMGSFMGCLAHNLKKRLAYSSISQISYVLLGIFILTPHGATGALLQFLFHALSKIGIFQCAGAIICLTGCTQVEELRGMGRRLPVTMLCFTFFSMSLVGIPPFGGFWSKWHLCLAALEGLPTVLRYLVPVVLILSALLTAGYLFAPIVSAFFPGEDCPAELTVPVKEPAALMLSPVVLSLAVSLPGLFPAATVSVMQRIAETLL